MNESGRSQAWRLQAKTFESWRSGSGRSKSERFNSSRSESVKMLMLANFYQKIRPSFNFVLLRFCFISAKLRFLIFQYLAKKTLYLSQAEAKIGKPFVKCALTRKVQMKKKGIFKKTFSKQTFCLSASQGKVSADSHPSL